MQTRRKPKLRPSNHTFDIKTISPLIPGKFGLKNETYSQCYKISQSEQVKFVNHKYRIWNCRSWPKIKNLGRFSLKIAICPIFMKFGTQNKLNMLIINSLIGIDDLDSKLQICNIWSQNLNLLQVLWNLALTTNRTCKLWIWYSPVFKELTWLLVQNDYRL